MMYTRTRLPGPALQLLRRERSAMAALLLALALAACATGGTAPTQPAGATSYQPNPPRLLVTSTLDGHAILPNRIHWQAFPSAPAANVSEVDFLIDDRLGWVEHQLPYFYGNDGNWLVTSFLSPGRHTFTVRVIDAAGHTATDTVYASVAVPPAPPPGLADHTWIREVTPADAREATSGQPPPPGRWQLRISQVGWQLHDPTGGGLLFDVGHLPGAGLQMRPTIEYPPYPNSNNGGFCQDTDPLSAWRYAVGDGGTTLTLQPSGHDSCGDRIAILAGTWTSAQMTSTANSSKDGTKPSVTINYHVDFTR